MSDREDRIDRIKAVIAAAKEKAPASSPANDAEPRCRKCGGECPGRRSGLCAFCFPKIVS